MTKSKLLEELVARYPDRSAEQLQHFLDAFFQTIQETLCQDDKVELRGFGSFRVRHRKPRLGRNPKTGEPVSVPAKKVPFFKAGRELKLMADQGV
jgi:integration host factor subunit beta